LVEPVGVGQPVDVLLGVRQDRPKQRSLVGHGAPSPLGNGPTLGILQLSALLHTLITTSLLHQSCSVGQAGPLPAPPRGPSGPRDPFARRILGEEPCSTRSSHT